MKLNFKNEKYPGTLITFCGLDGCGKTTMINMLGEYLENLGIKAVMTKQPTPEIRNFQMFRTFMDDPDNSPYDYRALSLHAAGDRIQHTAKFIVPLLESGQNVISDRYFYSCVANHRARGYDDMWIYEITGHIQKPDYAFFLDVDTETAITRVRARDAEKHKYIDIPLQHRLREQYLLIARECGGIIIKSEGGAEACFDEIKEELAPFIKPAIKQNF